MQVIVRLEVGCLRIVAERELQDRHAGKSKVIAQRFHLGSDDAEILGHDGQFPQRASSASNSGAPGPFTQLPLTAVASLPGIS